MRELQDKQVLKRGQWLDTNALSGKDWGPRFDWFKTNVDKKGTINMLATLFDIGDQAGCQGATTTYLRGYGCIGNQALNQLQGRFSSCKINKNSTKYYYSWVNDRGST